MDFKLLQCLPYATSLSLPNFVGSVVVFLNVLVIRLWSLLLAASLSFDREGSTIELIYTLAGIAAGYAATSNRNGI
jgi:hypothetical protein